MYQKFSAGEHVLTEPITCIDENLIIEGVAPNETTLIFDDCPAINCMLSGAQQFVLKNLTIKTTSPGRHTAINLTCADDSHYYSAGPIFENLCITGDNVHAAYWYNGLNLTNGWWATLKNVTVYGYAPDYRRAHHGMVLRGNCIGVTMDKVNTFFLRDGITVMGASEGLSMHHCHMVENQTGIYWNTPQGEPGLNVRGCHFHVHLFGIYTINLQQSNICNNLIYLMTDAHVPAAVWLNYLSNHVVTKNQIEVLPVKTKYVYGIIGSNISNHIVRDNTFQGVDYPTWIQ